MNTNYLYWDIDKTSVNWDDIYISYKPKFKKLSINTINDIILASQYFKEMIKDLSDGHLTITFNHPVLSQQRIFPASDRNLLRAESVISKQQQIMQNPTMYFVRGSTQLTTDPNLNLTILLGKIDLQISYIHFSNFYLTESYVNNGQTKLALDKFSTELSSPDTKAIILDLRNNAGGNVEDLNFFLGKFIKAPIHYGFLKYKQGNNRLDYSPLINSYVIPIVPAKTEKKIYILINSKTISMSEISTIALLSLNSTTTIGTKSWGAMGLLVNGNQQYNGGSFKVGDFMNISMSAASLTNIEHQNFEGKGITPMYTVEHKNDQKDLQLEYTLQLIKSQ